MQLHFRAQNVCGLTAWTAQAMQIREDHVSIEDDRGGVGGEFVIIGCGVGGAKGMGVGLWLEWKHGIISISIIVVVVVVLLSFFTPTVAGDPASGDV
ncbi:hypothetical protein L228DRAFT_84248 [Xylona heveae TC161]|uniref:Uncharacterized protein n=1 Tax=Xylona heveae (strain CBS 132557 / TC161) TaxID=1328760 RepID=A0A165J6U9_XYLHT|nr:hypothetical protein L228DRAFT_84248 [Xylona heveae TC161]KZF25816.1 hypothetical protein L228DRAFT_84248 [Xylona heveae TC161]